MLKKDKDSNAIIRFSGVNKSLLGREVLRDVDLEVFAGETFVIVGPTGAGKSVTLRHMIGLLIADSGEVLIEGENVAALNGRKLELFRRKFGYLFQSAALINWLSVGDNVALPLREKTNLSNAAIMNKVNEILELLDMDGTEKLFPESLSGGMRKRIGLARALIGEPQIMLYDEPTSGLDPVMSRHIDKMINSLRQKMQITSVVVTHDLHSAFSIGDRIALLRDGEIRLCDTPEKFRASENPEVREFIDAQFKIIQP